MLVVGAALMMSFTEPLVTKDVANFDYQPKIMTSVFTAVTMRQEFSNYVLTDGPCTECSRQWLYGCIKICYSNGYPVIVPCPDRACKVEPE